MKNSSAYNNFASVGSDHRVIPVKIKLSFRSSNKSLLLKVKYDRKPLHNDQEMQERYTVAIKNRFYALQEKEEKEENCNGKVPKIYRGQ